jgi:UDP-2-acetamido-2-deoxy-ribo-hexuluronate aminotransferase
MDFIDLKTQYRNLKQSIDARMQAVLDHGQYIMGPEIAELELKLAIRVGAKHCITCASGTDALLMALMALGVSAGDEVITTPFTFIATAETIALMGAKPVFEDIDPRSYNIDPTLIPRAITPLTKAIMPVSLYGQCADMDAVNAVAEEHGIPVIEDAAQSFGATYKGRQSCGLSTIGCTSFFPSKPLGCYGDGGACFTSDDEVAGRLRQIRAHGQDRRYHHPVIGINGRMDTLQAAVVLAKLEVFDQEVAARERIGTRYTEMLQFAVVTPQIEPHNTCVYAQYTIQVEDRGALQTELQAVGIPTAVHYPIPLNLQPAFAGLGQGPGSFPHAENAAHRVLSLPMHPYLSEDDQETIVAAVQTTLTLGGARK